MRNVESLAKSANQKPGKILKYDIEVVDRKNPNLEQIEEQIRKIVATKVRVRRKNKGGVFEMEYYSDDDLERLRFIRAAQATGFSLGDATALLRPAPCGRVQQLIEERLEHVEARMKDLRHVKRVLGAALKTCHEHEETGRCRVVGDLTATARSKPPR